MKFLSEFTIYSVETDTIPHFSRVCGLFSENVSAVSEIVSAFHSGKKMTRWRIYANHLV